jgi:hypothetical protein
MSEMGEILLYNIIRKFELYSIRLAARAGAGRVVAVFSNREKK